jgi:hypothetical protein
MKALLLVIGDLPWNVPFLAELKLTEIGFHWAPASFMAIPILHGGDLQLATSGPQARCTVEHLKFEYHILVVKRRLSDEDEGWQL